VPNKAARSKADVLQGTLDLMVLQTLDAWDRMAGIIHTLLHGEA
jgi:hypothetical protein